MEEPATPTPSQTGPNKAVLRVAWWVIGAGVLLAMSAAVAGGINPEAKVLPIRDLAAVVMLLGLVVVLGAYRAVWLQKIWEKSAMETQRAQSRQRNDVTLPLVILFSILLGGAFFVVAVVSLFGGMVTVYATLLLRSMVLAALASLLVYGKGFLRTFCLGAIIPVGLQAVTGMGAAMLALPPSAWQPYGLSSLDRNLASLALGGFLAVSGGVTAMMVRFLAENLQGSKPQQGNSQPRAGS